MFIESHDRLLIGNIVNQQNQIAQFDLIARVAAGIDHLCEYIFRVGAHIGRQYYFFMNFRDIRWKIGYYCANQRGFADSF